MLAKQIQALVLGSPSAAFAPGISSGKAPFQQAKEWERAIGNRHPRPNLGHQPPSQITKKQNPTGTLEFVLHFEADSYHLRFCPRRASWKIKRKFLFYRSFTGGLDLLFRFSLPISPHLTLCIIFEGRWYLST